ncbi:flagellin [Roseibium algae]|uniref:Flagellin n=1 Tax=Roseibium algae TaxID=3123038 RepID=A0ABU8TEL2_9HYPH
MGMRVSTFAQTSNVLQNAMTTQARLAEKQMQQSTGRVSTDYAGLGSTAGKVVNLEVSVSRAEATLSAAEQAQTRIEVIYDALGSMSDNLTKLRSDLSSASTGVSTETLQTTAEAMLEDMSSLLNTQLNGRYLFAGSATETAPVDISGYSVTSLSVVDSSYYNGDDYTQTVHLGQDRSIDYGITADASGLEKSMRVLSYIANASPLESEDLEEANTLLIEAQDQIIAMQSTAGTKSSVLDSYIENQKDYIASTKEMATTLASVDIAAVAVEATNYETQLEASYAALGKLTSLSVLEYLR